MSPRLVRLAQWFGFSLSLASVAFLAWLIVSEDLYDRLFVLPSTIVAVAVVIYALSNGLLAAAWLQTTGAGSHEVSVAFLFRIYARSIIAKYVPGNVFQFLSRQADLAQTGMSQGSIAMSSVREVAGLVLACCGLIALAQTLVWNKPTLVSAMGDILPGLEGHTVLGIGILAWISVVGLATYKRWVRPLALALQMAFFASYEFIGGLACSAVLGTAFAETIGLFSLSWLIGFLTIGAPGGLGVREIVIVGLLRDHGDQGALLGIATALRAITILGDIGFAVAVHVAPRGGTTSN